MSPLEVLILNGPNLDQLGHRQPELYGAATLDEILARLEAVAEPLGVRLSHVQSSHEGVLIDAIHEARVAGVSGAVVNAAAYTHTSVALRDALLSAAIPFVEVHLSNVWRREPFRHVSLLSDVALGIVAGFGPTSYELALRGLIAHLGGGAPCRSEV